jgi:dihydrofolate reductase
MGLLTFSINVTLDGCVDHREGIADDETHAFFTGLMDESGAMLWGRTTYEMMESYWPAVARGDEEAPPAMREWAVKLEVKPKYVVSSTRKDFPWTNSHHIAGVCAPACRSSRTRLRLACCSAAASSRPSSTGSI